MTILPVLLVTMAIIWELDLGWAHAIHAILTAKNVQNSVLVLKQLIQVTSVPKAFTLSQQTAHVLPVMAPV